jgi:hypothetical protein
MSITFGIYDLFSFILPGFFYLFEIVYVAYLFYPNNELNLFIKDLNIAHVLLLSIVAYALGHIVGVIARKLWYLIYKFEKIQNDTLIEVQQEYPKLQINFESQQWPALYAIIHEENTEHIAEIKWMKANHIMFRNLGFGLMVFAIIQAIQFFISGYTVIYLIISLSCLLMLYLTFSRSKSFIHHYHYMIYSAIVGRFLKGTELVNIKNEQGTKSKSAKKAG